MIETALFFSPHLDDVVLSCPGRVLDEVACGRRVMVATLFTEAGHGADAESRELYRRRRAEDRRAVAALGAEPRWLGLLDAPFRNPFYDSFRAIVLETHPDDAAFVDTVARAIHSLCEVVRPDTVHAPLGVGTHIDHRLTYAAVARLVESGELRRGATTFYEDRPYAYVRHQVRMRLAELELRPASPLPPDLEPRPVASLTDEFRASFDQAGYVRAYLAPGAEGADCRRRLVSKLLTSPAAGWRGARPEILALGRAAFDRCVHAAGAYISQIPDLFGSVPRLAAAAGVYTRWLGIDAPYGERAWRLEGSRSA